MDIPIAVSFTFQNEHRSIDNVPSGSQRDGRLVPVCYGPSRRGGARHADPSPMRTRFDWPEPALAEPAFLLFWLGEPSYRLFLVRELPEAATMTGRFAYLCVSIASLSIWAVGYEDCPSERDVWPCTCHFVADWHGPEWQGVEVRCSEANSSEEIRSAFEKASWPTTRLMLFNLRGNHRVNEVPEGAFGTVSFRAISVSRSVVKRIHPSAILSSKDRLEVLEMQFCWHLETFPFDVLPRLPRLRELDLAYTRLAAVPALRSPSLEVMDLSNCNISRVGRDGWATPNMRELRFNGNKLSRFPLAVITSWEKLELFECSPCNLDTTLATGALAFLSRSLKAISLQGDVARLEPGAITGIMPDTKISLERNKIELLKEDVFRPMLENLSLGSGSLNLRWNPIRCDCDVAWLICNPEFLWKVNGICRDGKDLRDLTSDSMRDCESVRAREGSACASPASGASANRFLGNSQGMAARDMNLFELSCIIQSEETTIAWCRGNGLLPCAADQEQPPPCLKAGCSGTLRDAGENILRCKKCKGGMEWEEGKASNWCAGVILALAWTWAYITITKSKPMLAGELSSLRNETFVDWRHFAREILRTLFASARPMGGPGEVIQIDESYFRVRRKNNKSRLMQGNAVSSSRENYGDVVDRPWIFGMAWHTELRSDALAGCQKVVRGG
ncbi:unnamed protein product [Darwinula stevensoni]|uniref:Uncharacterized protein n=1 Tax=Darwinula stevensoni TaxID=69355 RepID=A0A7R9A3S9_9CRUS|nr:unnamed protein product [Darwinula stevensoni]CAG0892245.1 unnamed protein product [Darwinula stevensoni]